jgi:hypothetical protein
MMSRSGWCQGQTLKIQHVSFTINVVLSNSLREVFKYKDNPFTNNKFIANYSKNQVKLKSIVKIGILAQRVVMCPSKNTIHIETRAMSTWPSPAECVCSLEECICSRAE